MPEKLIPATRVVIEVEPDKRIEGPGDHEIVMSSWVRNGKWAGVLTMLKSIFDDHSELLTIGSCHNVKFWTSGKPGSGNIKICEKRDHVPAGTQPAIDLHFEGTQEPELL